MLTSLDEVINRLNTMTPAAKEELTKTAIDKTRHLKIIPNVGQQTKAYFSDADIILYGGAGGGGKLLNLKEFLPTPTGFIQMGDVKVGDFLFDEQGVPCKVTALSEVEQTPEMYRFVFDDNTFIDSCVDHQWVTFTQAEMNAMTRLDPDWRARRRAKRPSKAKGLKSEAFSAAIIARNVAKVQEVKLPPTGTIRKTAEIVATLKQGKRQTTNHCIRNTSALVLPDVDYLVDPYVLGVWLGDGTASCGGLTGIDPEIWEEIEKSGYKVSHHKEARHHHILGIVGQLKTIGVVNNKHIPQEYMRGSYGQRLRILQGLMDTDGTVAKASGSAEFCNTNERIVDGVCELLASLGWKVNKREGRAKLYGKDCGPKWTLKFMPTDYVFLLERKRSIQKLASRRTTGFRYIVDAHPVPTQPGRCVMVDSPSHMYLAGRQMVPTHNSYLAIALAVQKHLRSIIFRREASQTDGLIANAKAVIGDDANFNGSDLEFNYKDGRNIKFAGLAQPDDWGKHAGRERDLMVFDEAGEFLEVQVASLQAWNRGPEGVHCQILLASNPPRTAEGAWLKKWFAPWLDPKFPFPAKDGEIRWACYWKGETTWVDGPEAVEMDGEMVYPKSRTFIGAMLKDNPFRDTNEYRASLQALPETLRKQMLHGDFAAGEADDAFQTIPTSWVREAQRRWTPTPPRGVPMCGIGVDVAQGGSDKTIVAPRYDGWYAPLIPYPGVETPDGKTVAGKVIQHRRDNCPVAIDVGGGWGGDAHAHLRVNNVDSHAYMGVKASLKRTVDKQLKFTNVRSEAYWRFREALDPSQAQGSIIALPDDPELVADLCAPSYTIGPQGIKVEAKVDVVKRLGRSPDRGDAVVMAWWVGPTQANIEGGWTNRKTTPKVNVGRSGGRRR